MRGAAPRTMRMAILSLGLLLAAAAPAMASGLMRGAIAEHCGSAPCPQRGAAARLTASLHGSGAHRSLQYQIQLRCPDDRSAAAPAAGQGGAATPPPPPHCGDVALLQPLPPAIFADIYQLDNAAAVAQGPAARLFGPVDVESIEARAQPTLLAVYANASAAAQAQQQPQGQQQVGWLVGLAVCRCAVCAAPCNGAAGWHAAAWHAAAAAPTAHQPPPFGSPLQAHQANPCSMTVTVPLHARYPHPRTPEQQQPASWLEAAASASAVVELPLPLVLARCPAPGGGGLEAAWQAVQLEQPGAAAAVRWQMPAGNLRHGPLVATGTVAAVGCGVAAVLYALWAPLGSKATRRQRQKRA